MELGGVLAGVAAGAGKADGKALVDDAALAVQHLAEYHFPGLLLGERAAVSGPEHPVTAGKAALAGQADDADGGGGMAGGDGGDDIHERSAPFRRQEYPRYTKGNTVFQGILGG